MERAVLEQLSLIIRSTMTQSGHHVPQDVLVDSQLGSGPDASSNAAHKAGWLSVGEGSVREELSLLVICQWLPVVGQFAEGKDVPSVT